MALTYGEQRAVNEINSILASQWENGMLPHIRFNPKVGSRRYRPDAKDWGIKSKISGNRNVKTSGITQPPILAWGVWRIYENSENKKEMLMHLEKWFPKIEKFYNFLSRERDPKHENIAYVTHPWATGLDNSFVLDEVVLLIRRYLYETNTKIETFGRTDTKNVLSDERPTQREYESYFYLIDLYKKLKYDQKKIFKKSPFIAQDVLFNVLFSESIRSLGKISNELCDYYEQKGEKTKANKYKEKKQRNFKLSDHIAKSIRNKMWDNVDNFFYGYDLRNKRRLWGLSIQGLSPLLGKIATKKQAKKLISHIKNQEEFWPKKGHPIPSLSVNSREFINFNYWKGPVWPVTNWLIIEGLKNYDKTLANKIKKETIKLIEGSIKNRISRDLILKKSRRINGIQ